MPRMLPTLSYGARQPALMGQAATGRRSYAESTEEQSERRSRAAKYIIRAQAKIAYWTSLSVSAICWWYMENPDYHGQVGHLLVPLTTGEAERIRRERLLHYRGNLALWESIRDRS